MIQYDPISVGEVLRKIRKSKGLRLGDLADENISTATLSNIERGTLRVKYEKVDYIINKLGLTMQELPEYIAKEQKNQEHVKSFLGMAESLVNMGCEESAYNMVKNMDVQDESSHASLFYWITGSYYMRKKKYEKAEVHFHNAIRTSARSRFTSDSNIEAYAFKDLGRCSYYQNDLQKALLFTDSGLDAYDPDGERNHIKYILLRNKSIYLERLGRIAEAFKIVQDVWSNIHRIDHIETLVSLYWLKSELLRKTSSFKESVYTAQEGIHKAGVNKLKSFSTNLWVTLGSSYRSLKELEKAEVCYDIAMRLAESTEMSNPYIRACISVSYLCMDRKDWDKAEVHLGKAIEKAKENECHFYLIDAYMASGILYNLQGFKDEAIANFRLAIKVADEYNYPQVPLPLNILTLLDLKRN
ncbi:helix-turn-helix domain-containing protein [Melghirimyces algeriensis]|uniref:Tetratricopeptide repeat-containing protein n=1 Tax=Melghirimyces algeriensis TaxID=910412 RepID=A0A521ERQ1_9BACL|nr:helix-turn-helix transcriptional regulator [Melghirimyces algeriensis]SMO86577.1 Tetratricopeptide repeat-containing protein [Melghirimyces algeriensis]